MITRESTCCGCRQSMMNLNYLANCAPLAFQVGGNRDKKKSLPPPPNPHPQRKPWLKTHIPILTRRHSRASTATQTCSSLWAIVGLDDSNNKKRGTGYSIKSGCCLVVTHARLCWYFTRPSEFYHDRPGRCSHDEREIEIDFWRILLRSRLWLLLPLFFRR